MVLNTMDGGETGKDIYIASIKTTVKDIEDIRSVMMSENRLDYYDPYKKQISQLREKLDDLERAVDGLKPNKNLCEVMEQTEE